MLCKRQVIKMRKFNMFITPICVLFLVKLTHFLCPLWFWWSLLFWAFFAITVISFIRRSQGCTLWFWPLSTQRWCAPKNSTQSAFFSPIIIIPAHYTENKLFLAAFPSPLLGTTPCDIFSGHHRRRGLGPGSILSLLRVVWSIYV